MSVRDTVDAILAHREAGPKVVHTEVIPGKQAVFGKLDPPLPEAITQYLEGRCISLYSHQCESVTAIRNGWDLILTTPTASGKTLAFTLPIFERFLSDPLATALYVYPTKALTQDQHKAVAALEAGTGIPVFPSVYDGDTPREKRAAIRERSRLILSNAHELHQILPYHHLWTRFLAHLQFVVIDEAHRYRGVFGSHTALLLRRLRRICSRYGADPSFILSTATLANPAEFAFRLTGRQAKVISSDGSAHGRRFFMLYNPFHDGIAASSVHRETSDLFVQCVNSGLQTLCFTGARKSTELVTLIARDALLHSRSRRPEDIAAYRAGYLPGERRLLEEKFKNGELSGLVSTNALEVGIDIGSLDAVLISGYPGTQVATWQQAGRAGRGRSDSLAVLVGFQNPLDQYFMQHPDRFFGAPHEHAIIDLANPYILAGQLLCAAAELPVDKEADSAYFGELLAPLVDSQAKEHLLSPTRRGYVYSGRRRPADLVSLGGSPDGTFRVVCNGKVLETMDRPQAYREAHRGAILLHQGERYLVRSMDLEERLVRAEPIDLDYYTKPLKTVDIAIVREDRSRAVHGTTLCFGEVQVTEQYTAFKTMQYDTVISIEPLDLPPLSFRTKAIWFPVPPDEEFIPRIREGSDFGGGLHGVEHALIAVMPFFVMCDRWDIGGLSVPSAAGTGDPAVFIYDGYEGGIGLSEKAYSLFEEIAAMAYGLVKDCVCEEGCPACIYSPKCGNDNVPLDKFAASDLLGWLALPVTGTTACDTAATSQSPGSA